MGKASPQMYECGQQPVGEDEFVLRPGSCLTLTGSLAPLVACRLTARLPTRSEFFHQRAQMLTREAAEGMM